MAAKFGVLLMRTIASFQRYTGYLNFINGPISRVLLLILIYVQLLSCLSFRLLALLRIKTMSLNIAQQFMKGMVKIHFGVLKFRRNSKGFQSSSLFVCLI